tara:strand:- start:149 stop:700 length:552 start_codon:yes stop_codon:yes gene_type:complete
MTDKMINGILFVIAGLGPVAVYLGLGPDGTGILDNATTEKIAAYVLVALPLAFMMTRNIKRNPFIDAGFLIIVVAWSAGIVSDAITGAELSAESTSIGEAIAPTAWSLMFLGIFITGIGYLRTNLFPQWLSGLLSVASLGAFAFLAILSAEQIKSNEEILIPLWMGVSVVLVILGIFTIRRAE